MIRLQMGDYQISRLLVTQNSCQIGKPLVGRTGIHRIHNGNLFVHDDVRVVGNTVRNHILAFKQIERLVVYADIQNGIRNCNVAHKKTSVYRLHVIRCDYIIHEYTKQELF